MFACNKINQSQGLIDIHDYKILDFEDYGSELKKENNLLDVQKATLIKTKAITSTPPILTFKEKELPRFIEVPGEQVKTKVFDYYERPMSCKTCLRYGYTAKRCRETIATCTRCSCQGHNKDSAPVPKSNAATAEKTTKYSQGIVLFSKEKMKSSKSKENSHTQTTGLTKTSQTKPKFRINLLKRSKEHF